MARFVRAFPAAGGSRILDVGGTAEIWELLPDSGSRKIVLLNMPRAAEKDAGLESVYGDGCRLPFADRSFDIVFSNSVIEHVGNASAQAQFAQEIMRAGRGYWVQTPNRHFPIEAHLLTPFVHWLPQDLRAAIVRRFTVWAWLHRPAPDRKHFYIEHFISDIRLLTAREMQELFPDAVILRERFLGLTKSLVAYRHAPELPSGHRAAREPGSAGQVKQTVSE